jgi:hypothetical protein
MTALLFGVRSRSSRPLGSLAFVCRKLRAVPLQLAGLDKPAPQAGGDLLDQLALEQASDLVSLESRLGPSQAVDAPSDFLVGQHTELRGRLAGLGQERLTGFALGQG